MYYYLFNMAFIYNNILCLGDSQTFGARSYGCYPIYLSSLLEQEVEKVRGKEPCYYRVINKSVNGYTARDLYFKINNEAEDIKDVYMACLMIGTNDCHKNSDVKLFGEYLKQIILTLKTKGVKVIYFGLIPEIYNEADPWYQNDVQKKRKILNEMINSIAAEFGAFIVDTKLDITCYADSVHFNEKGNAILANKFKEVIMLTSHRKYETIS